MWKFLISILAILHLLLCATVYADSVVSIDTLQALRDGDAGTATNVNVKGYAGDRDGGGGHFIQLGSSCTDDDGVIVQEHATLHCWYRQFSGPVHLSWYGVPDAATFGCYNVGFSGCDATALVKKALAAAAVGQNLGGDGGVTTDGRSIAILTQCDACADGVGIEIPKDQYLTCDGPSGGSRGLNSSTPYWTLPHSIVLHPRLTVQRDAHTHFWGCIERPDWLYPQTSEDPDGLTIPPTNVHQTVTMMRQFTGTGTTCADKACNMDNMLIIGFDTCDDCGGVECAHAPWDNIVELCSHRTAA
jgi:hypothetical protein